MALAFVPIPNIDVTIDILSEKLPAVYLIEWFEDFFYWSEKKRNEKLRGPL